jgi:hypothetical protein
LSCLIQASCWENAPRWGGRLRCWLAAPLPLPQTWTCCAVQIVTRVPLSLYLGPRLVNVEGPPKKNRRTPRTLTKSPTHPPTIRLFFFLDFFLVRFWAFLGKGSSKTPQKYFCKKSMSKTFSKISTKNFDDSFSSTFFLFYRVFGCFSAMGVQKHNKKRFTKKIMSKIFTKNSTKNPKPTFSRKDFYHVFGRFSMRGVQKHDKKISKK